MLIKNFFFTHDVNLQTHTQKKKNMYMRLPLYSSHLSPSHPFWTWISEKKNYCHSPQAPTVAISPQLNIPTYPNT